MKDELTKNELAVADALLEWERIFKLTLYRQEENEKNNYTELPAITSALDFFANMLKKVNKAKTPEETIKIYEEEYGEDYADGSRSIGEYLIENLGVDMRKVAAYCLLVTFNTYEGLTDKAITEATNLIKGEKK